MRAVATFSILVALALGSLLIQSAPAAGSEDFARPQDEIAQKLDALTKRVARLEAEKSELEIRLTAQGTLLKQVYGWMRSLSSASDSLSASMDEARKNGFAKAGPNPRAKKNVLNGIKAFAKAVKSENPAQPADKTKK